MIRRCLALLLTPGVLLVGCGSPSSGNSGPSPGSAGSSASPVATAASSTPTSTSTPSPSTTPTGLIRGGYAVLVTSLNAAPYTLRLVDITGQSLASARAAGRSPIRLGSIGNSAPAVFMPTVSASATRAYYLDGDSAVRSLTVDGKTSLVTQIPGSATVEAGFAVSPDNRRIAVSAINYGVSPPALRLYVENLAGGGNHSELLASSSLYVWPVAWQGSSLILAVGPATAQVGAPNPYDAINGYHLVDPATANRLAAICVPPATGQGVISAIGSLCGGPNDGVFLQRWDGNRKPIQSDCRALSPSGTFAACGGGNATATTGPIWILTISNGAGTPTGVSGWGPLGWVDDEHLIFAGGSSSDVRILDLKSGKATPVGQYLYIETRFGGSG